MKRSPNIEMLLNMHNKALDNLNEFQKKFIKNPFEALKWVNAAVENAATTHVLGEVLRVSDETTDSAAARASALEYILNYAHGRARLLAERGHVRSTGALDAALHAEELRAWSTVIAVLEGWV